MKWPKTMTCECEPETANNDILKQISGAEKGEEDFGARSEEGHEQAGE